MDNQMVSQLNNMLNNFCQAQLQLIEQGELDFKNYQLPLARIKKVMKTDDDVKPMMISAEAPIVFAKACEIFILELTLRAWMQTDECKRRTLQRNDVAVAITRSDIFDFLIDIVPRDDNKAKKTDYPNSMVSDNASYFFQQAPGLNMGYPVNSPGSLMYQTYGQAAGYDGNQDTNENSAA